ncbi:MAG: hypothetical protein FWC34_08770 [Bacteroidetes bacterium]|nr:hypothetical protein [Bacteroidota bacterium]MCL2302368.1 hypothetical protein [Lentimicrobiaceae bacterium]
MKKCSFLLFLSIIAFLNFSCRKTDITPAYLLLSVEDFQNCINVSNFNKIHDTNYDAEELDIMKQQNFTDVLVTLNGKELGYWKLPCKIPLLPDYSHQNNLEIIPCVRVPNTTFTTVEYGFLNPAKFLLDMNKEGKYELSDLKSDLKFEYREEVVFTVLETFTQSTRFVPDSNYKIPIEIVHESGKSMGKIALEDTLYYFKVATPHFTLDLANKAGRVVRHFWELYYKCDDGLMTTYLTFSSNPKIEFDGIVLPSTNGVWKRAYFDITNLVTPMSDGSYKVSVSLGIKGHRASNNSKNAYFYFESMKLISGAPIR